MPKPEAQDSSSAENLKMETPPFLAADRRYGESPEKTVQRSVSLRPSQWKRLDVVGDLTHWGRSGTISQAVDLLTSLPITTTQRVATLIRTTARETLLQRFGEAVSEAIAAAEAELPDHPWAEFDAALMNIEEGSELSSKFGSSTERAIGDHEARVDPSRSESRGQRRNQRHHPRTEKRAPDRIDNNRRRRS